MTKYTDKDADDAMRMASCVLIALRWTGPFRLVQPALGMAAAVFALMETHSDEEKAKALIKELYPEMVLNALPAASEAMAAGDNLIATLESVAATKQ